MARTVLMSTRPYLDPRDNMNKNFLAAAALVACAAAQATPITGTSGLGAPIVTGATGVVTFETDAIGSYASLTDGTLTVSGIGGNIRVANDYAGEYNGRDTRYLDNSAGGTNGFRFDFSTTVSGFAFNWGASDVAWTLSAYDALGTLIETAVAPITGGSNAGDYFGLSAAGIKYATLTASSDGDWVFIDNIAYAAQASNDLPEPGSIALIGLALLGAGVARRRSR